MQISQQTPAHPGWQRPQADQYQAATAEAAAEAAAAAPAPG